MLGSFLATASVLVLDRWFGRLARCRMRNDLESARPLLSSVPHNTSESKIAVSSEISPHVVRSSSRPDLSIVVQFDSNSPSSTPSALNSYTPINSSRPNDPITYPERSHLRDGSAGYTPRRSTRQESPPVYTEETFTVTPYPSSFALSQPISDFTTAEARRLAN